MDDYASKPFDPDTLLSTMRQCIEKALAQAGASLGGTSAEQEAPPEGAVTVLDPAIVEPLRRNKPDLWRRLVGIYLRTTPASLEALETALSASDCAALQMTAHTLKSSSANMGAAGLSDLCRRLEAAAGQANLESAPDLIAEIQSEYGMVSTALSNDDEAMAAQSMA